MRIVLASRNAGKLRELEALFAPLDLSLESQDDHGVPSPAEDGLTFIENALIKARAVAGATGRVRGPARGGQRRAVSSDQSLLRHRIV